MSPSEADHSGALAIELERGGACRAGEPLRGSVRIGEAGGAELATVLRVSARGRHRDEVVDVRSLTATKGEPGVAFELLAPRWPPPFSGSLVGVEWLLRLSAGGREPVEAPLDVARDPDARAHVVAAERGDPARLGRPRRSPKKTVLVFGGVAAAFLCVAAYLAFRFAATLEASYAVGAAISGLIGGGLAYGLFSLRSELSGDDARGEALGDAQLDVELDGGGYRAAGPGVLRCTVWTKPDAPPQDVTLRLTVQESTIRPRAGDRSAEAHAEVLHADSVTLERTAPGVYEGAFELPPLHRLPAPIETPIGSIGWHVSVELRGPSDGTTTIGTALSVEPVG